MDAAEIHLRLSRVAETLDEMYEDQRDDLERICPRMNPNLLKDANGRPLLLDTLIARAQVLTALVGIETAAPKPISRRI